MLLLGGACLAQQTGAESQPAIPPLKTTIVITASPVEPTLDRRNAEVFDRTLFSRDDQILHVLDAGINAGQHEGGGKSLEIRRFGFNLDHGGVNGGLKILVDNIQQNQTTQGHGQGYLGSLKSVIPELVKEVNIVNGPFSAEYGDFSGLGVVHILLHDALADQFTARIQGGSFGSLRTFLGFSPQLRNGDLILAYEGSHTDGPFQQPLDYSRHNATAHYTRRLSASRTLGLRFNGGTNGFYSSGQIPLDEIETGRLDPFGAIDPTQGGRSRSATAGLYYRMEDDRGRVLKFDGFVSRSLLDLYSNFTYFLNDPVAGDAFQQHDSRLQQGANGQYLRPGRLFGHFSVLTAGFNFHGNQINVGLYPRIGRVPTGVATAANANVTNAAGYVQESVSLANGRVQLGGGLRFDTFRFDVRDRVSPEFSGVHNAARAQPKASFAATPFARVPVTFYANYGRGISTADARGIVQRPDATRVATTDFYQVGASHRFGRFSASTSAFLIDRSNELVYIADDGSFDFLGPSRAYGFEAKAAVDLTRRWALNAGLTKVVNVFYRGTAPRVYVDRAPHFVANAGLTASSWRGWSGSFRMRAINHYRLDGEAPHPLAAGHVVFDFALARRVRRGVELNFSADNLFNRLYYETQNYFESRLPGREPIARIHATPGYPRTIAVGLTFRLFGK
jgi:outer membrane receptor protein involved in Fe transport